jgi:tripartite-type tricarboxylate transporter receptor subunit TctC
MKLAQRLMLFVVSIVLAAQATAITHAENYPTRSVTFIIPFAPGGNFDIVARVLGNKLSERLGQPFIVEHRTGAGTAIAASAVARAAPDGYTLLVAASGTLSINPTLYKKLSYDPVNDFVPIALISSIPLVLVVNPSLPVYSVSDLVKLAREKPGQLSYASNGPGTSFHLAAELLKSMTGIEMVHVPYKGAVPALSDVIAGHVQLMFADPGASLPHIRAGKVRALGVSSLTRLPAAPDIPTIAETGIPGFEAVSWSMIVAPANTPSEIVNKLHTELQGIMALPEVQQQIAMLGIIPVSSPPPEQLRQYIQSEIIRWGKLVRQAGIFGSE